MTDRELLEMAAKAAGAEHNGYRYGENGREPLYGMPIETEDGFEYRKWNPLIDDGDALRLAVRLKIEIVISDQSATAVVDMIGYRELLGADPYAATRRAIVRAAAELGREME